MCCTVHFAFYECAFAMHERIYRTLISAQDIHIIMNVYVDFEAIIKCRKK